MPRCLQLYLLKEELQMLHIVRERVLTSMRRIENKQQDQEEARSVCFQSSQLPYSTNMGWLPSKRALSMWVRILRYFQLACSSKCLCSNTQAHEKFRSGMTAASSSGAVSLHLTPAKNHHVLGRSTVIRLTFKSTSPDHLPVPGIA